MTVDDVRILRDIGKVHPWFYVFTLFTTCLEQFYSTQIVRFDLLLVLLTFTDRFLGRNACKRSRADIIPSCALGNVVYCSILSTCDLYCFQCFRLCCSAISKQTSYFSWAEEEVCLCKNTSRPGRLKWIVKIFKAQPESLPQRWRFSMSGKLIGSTNTPQVEQSWSNTLHTHFAARLRGWCLHF